MSTLVSRPLQRVSSAFAQAGRGVLYGVSDGCQCTGPPFHPAASLRGTCVCMAYIIFSITPFNSISLVLRILNGAAIARYCALYDGGAG